MRGGWPIFSGIESNPVETAGALDKSEGIVKVRHARVAAIWSGIARPTV